MAKIAFESTPFQAADPWVGGGILLRLPMTASELLPSRGMSMVIGQISGITFEAAVEPDGDGSHWFRLNPSLLDAAKVEVGKPLKLEIEPTKQWPEPKVPDDLKEILASDSKARAIWDSLTTAAKWDWIRWLGACRQAETRQRRVDSIPSRLASGKRRPCCFNRNECTLTDA